MTRNHNKSIAESTVQILRDGAYQSPAGRTVRIASAVDAAVEATKLFTPDQLADLLARPASPQSASPVFEVNNETTLAAASRLVVDRKLSRVLALNFASAKNPGGGFLSGAQAQEESLARSSALYPTLLAAPDYYTANRNHASNLYTDHMILSPDVPVIRNDAGDLLDEPYPLTFLTAPAPNAGAVQRNTPDQADRIAPVLARRSAMVLALAEHTGYRHLVLGAWGCGVFGNDPTQVARTFATLLLPGGRHAHSFETVIFAVLDRSNETTIAPFRQAFRALLKGI